MPYYLSYIKHEILTPLHSLKEKTLGLLRLSKLYMFIYAEDAWRSYNKHSDHTATNKNQADHVTDQQ